jgi:small-conductance mechanosensitive channel
LTALQAKGAGDCDVSSSGTNGIKDGFKFCRQDLTSYFGLGGLCMNEIIDFIRNFFQHYTLFAIAVVLIFLICLIRSPKETFKFIAFLAVMGVAFYLLRSYGGTMTTGVGQKEKLIEKSRAADQ